MQWDAITTVKIVPTDRTAHVTFYISVNGTTSTPERLNTGT